MAQPPPPPPDRLGRVILAHLAASYLCFGVGAAAVWVLKGAPPHPCLLLGAPLAIIPMSLMGVLGLFVHPSAEALAAVAVVAAGYVPTFYLVWRKTGPRRVDPNLCPGCGYDVRATPERCPECGRLVAPPRDL